MNIVSLLLERGVEVDLLTGSGVSPLHLAAKEGNVEVVDMLLEHGASPCTQSMVSDLQFLPSRYKLLNKQQIWQFYDVFDIIIISFAMDKLMG